MRPALSQQDIADHLGISQVQAGRLEAGSRTLHPDQVKSLAALFGVSEAVVLGQQDAPQNISTPKPPLPIQRITAPGTATDLPLRGMIPADRDDGVILSDDGNDIIGHTSNRSDLYGTNAFAMYVNGSAMEPKFSDEEIIVVAPGRKIKPGAYVVIVDHSGLALPRRLKEISEAGCIVSTTNPEQDVSIKTDQIAAIYPIVASWLK